MYRVIIQSLVFLSVFWYPLVAPCEPMPISNCATDFASAVVNLTSPSMQAVCNVMSTYKDCLSEACNNNIPQTYIDLLNTEMGKVNATCDGLLDGSGGGGGTALSPLMPLAISALLLLFVIV